jgi:hypothetical protein
VTGSTLATQKRKGIVVVVVVVVSGLISRPIQKVPCSITAAATRNENS